MNKLILSGIISLFLKSIPLSVQCQDQQDDGKVLLQVHSDFRKELKKEGGSAFEVKRVYFGYTKNINSDFTAEVKLDIGSPEDESQYSLSRRYAYFKKAGLNYYRGRFNAYFGLFEMLQFKTQEKAWGYRYIAKSFQDEYKYGPSADIGIGAKYKINDFLEADLIVSNGEGYSSLQADDNYNTGMGLTYTNQTGITMRAYFDFIAKEVLQSDISFFAGYKNKMFRLAAEYNQKSNTSYLSDHDLNGYSFYGTYNISEKWEVFGRYDILRSNTLLQDDQPWNIQKDGSAIISGIQFKPDKKIYFSLNYQDWVSYAKNGSDKAYLYFSMMYDL
ncbi:MAG: porin [Bacteroidales bacterium]|nr:porin [Bacteroidales bacterium]MCB8998967.1 porin [Bacteroidales bacterium]MCB9013746.1 porin [Bacteroidales bacterium]